METRHHCVRRLTRHTNDAAARQPPPLVSALLPMTGSTTWRTSRCDSVVTAKSLGYLGYPSSCQPEHLRALPGFW